MCSSSGVLDEAAPTKLSAEDDGAESNDACVGDRVIELAVEGTEEGKNDDKPVMVGTDRLVKGTKTALCSPVKEDTEAAPCDPDKEDVEATPRGPDKEDTEAAPCDPDKDTEAVPCDPDKEDTEAAPCDPDKEDVEAALCEDADSDD